MTTKDVALPASRTPQIGQATAVEQSRAVAEVEAAVLVAQRVPRDMTRAIAQMEQSCARPALAERSSYRFSRAGQQVSGPTVHLARELARCFGNVQYGIAELRRDDVAGESEMLAFAWDVQTNTRSTMTFIVPHKRDTKSGAKPLTDLRDIYENNTNHGARRLRECIFSILPPWFTESAQDICAKTLADPGDGKAIEQRRAELVKRFGDLGVTEDDLTRKLGRAVDKWTGHDLATLTVIGRSMSRGEVTREDEFPSPKVRAADVVEARRPATEDTPDDEKPVPARVAPALAQKILDQLGRAGVHAKDASRILGVLARHTGPTDAEELTPDEGQRITEVLVRIGHADNPARALDHLLGELADAKDVEPS